MLLNPTARSEDILAVRTVDQHTCHIQGKTGRGSDVILKVYEVEGQTG